MTLQALHYKKYSTASDVWSYGALMYEIWSVGHKPFESLANDKVKLDHSICILCKQQNSLMAIYIYIAYCHN